MQDPEPAEPQPGLFRRELERVIRHCRPLVHVFAPARSASTSVSSGIASAHASRDATSAPAALQNRITALQRPPASSPWHSAPPNASPAPRPLTTSTGTGGTSTRSSPVVGEHALRALLDDRQLDAAVAQRLGSGARLALADRGLASSRLPTATVTCSQRAAHPVAGVLARRQNIGR